MDPAQIILDVKEKTAGGARPPVFPTPTSSSTGFPEHKKRTRTSAFKQRRRDQGGSKLAHGERTPSSSPPAPSAAVPSQAPADRVGHDLSVVDKARINDENQARVESMSQAELEDARQELLDSLDPSVLQMLLKRANIDEPNSLPGSDEKPSQQDSRRQPSAAAAGEPLGAQGPISGRTSAGEVDVATDEAGCVPKKKVTFDEDSAPLEPPSELFPLTSQPSRTDNFSARSHTSGSTHFPSAPPAPDLDPSDPDFLANLHSKYFPHLPADPSKLAWMAPIPTAGSVADKDSPYHPSQSSLPVSALRFDFRGSLLPPRVSRSIPVTKGLHHHGEAPEAAGYTITELARLARSAVPGQRCVAFQALGRILYRLGKGEWGIGQGGRVGEEDDLAFSMWRLVRQGRVVETLEEAAGVEEGGGHRSARAYAIEALWLAEKGGWRERWRGL